MSNYSKANWRSLNLGEMLARNARKTPEKLALVFEKTKLSYRGLNNRVNQLANALSKRNVKEGTKVAIMSYNSHRVVESFFACNKLGAVAVPINFRLIEEEVRYILANSDSEVFIFGKEFTELSDRLVSGKVVRNAIQMEGETSAHSEDYEEIIACEQVEEPDVYVSDESDAFIMYTSGTTGRPKGAVLTHKNLWMNTTNWSMEMQVTNSSVWLSGLPLFHIGGLNGVLPFIFVGGTNVLTSSTGFAPKPTLELISASRATHCYFVPTQWQQIIEEDLSQYNLKQIKKALWGASIAPIPVIEGILKAFPSVEIVNAFGQTEMSSNTCFLKGDDTRRKIGAVGLPAVNVEIRIVDDFDQDVQQGEVGEIVYKGPTVFKEYYKNPAATAEAMRNGWFHSGDLVYQDEEGYIFIVDRKKDMIISGGENIYPAEVEQVIRKHPLVEDVSVVGVPHEKWVETPKAYVVTKDNEKVTAEEIVEHCQKHLASYKKPTSVVFIDELPRNAAGKVLRRELRELEKIQAP
ncbi:AMP-dependent synthetase and ligase [Neobacillus bataviensis LMG 21833]|uniref:AMP-dependent synthetase and ligase n=1 Tax=Neobacillus bataviensis LMG 21833 TaxID=1117379 RepID=K6CIP9_9BACI|nr:o-succinylbenzoate--CoA ligase [Neobacillus bataviensis]EKN70995.1 AMP-dependent synthetase and ligase [Neobacillus bataviensis LMG 21833]